MDSAQRCLLIVLEGLDGKAFSTARARGLLAGPWFEMPSVALEFPLASARIATLVSTYTGAWPHRHGITSAELRTAEGSLRPVRGRDRSACALWEIFDRAGLPTVVVGWPAAITGDTQYSSQVEAGFGTAVPPGMAVDLSGWIHPPELSATLQECWLRPEEIGAEMIAELVPDWQKVNQEVDSRLVSLALILAENASRHAAFLELMATRPWALASLCLSLPAEIASLVRLSEPMADGLLAELTDHAWRLLVDFLQSIRRQVPAGTNVILVGLPHPECPVCPGILCAEGPAFSRFKWPRTMSVVHVAQWVASATGLTKSGEPQEPGELPAFRGLLEIDKPILKRNGESPTRAEFWHYNTLQVLAASHSAQNDPLGALPYWEALARLAPNDYETKLQLADCRRRLGLIAEARDAAYAALHPQLRGDPRPLLLAASLEVQLGYADSARELLRRAETEVGKSYDHRFEFAKVWARIGAWEKAVVIFRGLVQERPDDASAHFFLARCEIARRNWQSALEHALRSSQLGPPSSRLLELMSHAFLGLGMRDQARQALDSACALSPDWPRPRAKRYLLARETNEPAATIQALRQDYQEVRKNAVERQRTRLAAALGCPAVNAPG